MAERGGTNDELGHRGAARVGDTSDLTRDLGVFRVDLRRIDQRERAVDTFAHSRRHARKGIAVEMPLRRSRVDALDVITYSDGIARLDLRVSSGTYIRAIATALGGHCRTLRRTEVGPFRVDEADPERIVPPEQALARIGLGPSGEGAP